MDAPKISVLVPMYNRRHIIDQCVDSVLAQTFQDFELIIRDDGSTDGSADFVAERYAAEISSGKIKLRRNEKNLGEFPTTIKLIREATGKYFMILHSDDLYLIHALEHLYSVAEETQADVVHSCYTIFSPKRTTAPIEVYVKCYENNPVDKVTVMPNDLFERFREWATDGTFVDYQYNFFRRDFIRDNNLFVDEMEVRTDVTWLRWILTAKIFVKTPEVTYVYRPSNDSLSKDDSKFSFENFIDNKIYIARYLDRLLPELKFFADCPEIQRFIKMKLLVRSHQVRIARLNFYRDGISREFYDRIENIFRKHYGDGADYVTVLFHMMFMLADNSYNWVSFMRDDGLKRIMATPSKAHGDDGSNDVFT